MSRKFPNPFNRRHIISSQHHGTSTTHVQKKRKTTLSATQYLHTKALSIQKIAYLLLGPVSPLYLVPVAIATLQIDDTYILRPPLSRPPKPRLRALTVSRGRYRRVWAELMIGDMIWCQIICAVVNHQYWMRTRVFIASYRNYFP